jgi:Flp pilus assembly protein TadG
MTFRSTATERHRDCADRRRALFRAFFADVGRGNAGVAAIEFAVIAMMLVLMALGTLDLGLGFYRKMQVQNAAQAGAQYAMLHAFDGSTVGAIESAALNATALTGLTFPQPPARSSGCAGPTGIATPDLNYLCPDGSSAATYVTVVTQSIYNPVLAFPALGIPESFIFNASATVRIQ